MFQRSVSSSRNLFRCQRRNVGITTALIEGASYSSCLLFLSLSSCFSLMSPSSPPGQCHHHYQIRNYKNHSRQHQFHSYNQQDSTSGGEWLRSIPSAPKPTRNYAEAHQSEGFEVAPPEESGGEEYANQKFKKSVALTARSNDAGPNYYDLLGVPPMSRRSVIERAYRQLQQRRQEKQLLESQYQELFGTTSGKKRGEPDSSLKNVQSAAVYDEDDNDGENEQDSSPQHLAKIEEAYRTLTDPHARRLYDQSLPKSVKRAGCVAGQQRREGKVIRKGMNRQRKLFQQLIHDAAISVKLSRGKRMGNQPIFNPPELQELMDSCVEQDEEDRFAAFEREDQRESHRRSGSFSQRLQSPGKDGEVGGNGNQSPSSLFRSIPKFFPERHHRLYPQAFMPVLLDELREEIAEQFATDTALLQLSTSNPHDNNSADSAFEEGGGDQEQQMLQKNSTRKKGGMLSNVWCGSIVKYEKGQGELHVDVQTSSAADNGRSTPGGRTTVDLSRGDIVAISHQGLDIVAMVGGVIVNTTSNSNSSTVILSIQPFVPFHDEATVQIIGPLTRRGPFDRSLVALHSLPSVQPWWQAIAAERVPFLFPSDEKQQVAPQDDENGDDSTTANLDDADGYNIDQRKAITEATQGYNAVTGQFTHGEPLVLIQGPPGTGKTHTILGILAEYFSQSSEAPIRRALVVAPSNAAIDELVIRIRKHGLCTSSVNKEETTRGSTIPPGEEEEEGVEMETEDRIGEQQNQKQNNNQVSSLRPQNNHRRRRVYQPKLVRIGVRHNIDPWILEQGDIFIDDLVPPPTFSRYAAKQQQSGGAVTSTSWGAYKKEVEDCLHQTELILCTLGSFHRIPKSVSTPLVVHDEASQATEPSSIAPLLACSRGVLLGDPKQLRPTVLSQRAVRAGFSRSLMERLMQRNFPSYLLRYQYRMHPSILAFPNKAFYQDELRTAPVLLQSILGERYPPTDSNDTSSTGKESQGQHTSTSSSLELSPSEIFLRTLLNNTSSDQEHAMQRGGSPRPPGRQYMYEDVEESEEEERGLFEMPRLIFVDVKGAVIRRLGVPSSGRGHSARGGNRHGSPAENAVDHVPGSSYCNMEEVQCVCQLVQSWKKQHSFQRHMYPGRSGNNSMSHQHHQQQNLGVITFYTAQQNALRRTLMRGLSSTIKGPHGHPQNIEKWLKVSTVDGFQGQERSGIILSCVRSGGGRLDQDMNPSTDQFSDGQGFLGAPQQQLYSTTSTISAPASSIGFLADKNRLNVALTRAKHFCIVVGDAEHLAMRDPVFEALVEHCRYSGGLLSSSDL